MGPFRGARLFAECALSPEEIARRFAERVRPERPVVGLLSDKIWFGTLVHDPDAEQDHFELQRITSGLRRPGLAVHATVRPSRLGSRVELELRGTPAWVAALVAGLVAALFALAVPAVTRLVPVVALVAFGVAHLRQRFEREQAEIFLRELLAAELRARP